MKDKIYLRDLKEVLTGGVVICGYNIKEDKPEILYQTYAVESGGIPDEFLNRKVCGIGAYLDCEMNYVLVELE